MTVAEMIAKLKEFPPSAIVAVEQPYCAEESWLVAAVPALFFNETVGHPCEDHQQHSMVVSLSPGFPREDAKDKESP